MSAQKIKIECSSSLKDAFREGVRRGLAILSIVIFMTMLGGGSRVYASALFRVRSPTINQNFRGCRKISA